MKRRLVLLGPPASGKGTQAEFISRRFNVPTVSPGALLRAETKAGTALGQEAAAYTEAGRLVPNEMVCRVVGEWLRSHQDFTFDGFPRSLGQADFLDTELNQRNLPVEAALYLVVDADTISRRVLNRVVCTVCGGSFAVGWQVASTTAPCPNCGGKLSQRRDDTLAILEERMREYRETTEPVIEFYRRQGVLHSIDSSRAPEYVFEQICGVLNPS